MSESGTENPFSSSNGAMDRSGIMEEGENRVVLLRDKTKVHLRTSRLVDYLQNRFKPYPIYLDLTHPIFQIDRQKLNNQANNCVRAFFSPNVYITGVPMLHKFAAGLNQLSNSQKVSLLIVRELGNSAMCEIRPTAETNLTPQFVQECIKFQFNKLTFNTRQCTLARSAMALVNRISKLLEPFNDETEYFVDMMTSKWCGEEFLGNEAYLCLGFTHSYLKWITIFGLLSLSQSSIAEAYIQKNPFKILQIISWFSKLAFEHDGSHPIEHFMATDPTNWEGIIRKLTLAIHNRPNLNEPEQRVQIRQLVADQTDWRIALIGMFWLSCFDDPLPEWIYQLSPIKLDDNCVIVAGQLDEIPKHTYLSEKFSEALRDL